MSIAASRGPFAVGGERLPMLWILPLLGLAAMYLPPYAEAAASIWQTDDHGHVPLVLAVALWLFWQQRTALSRAPWQAQWPLGGAALAAGLLLYLSGRATTSAVLVFLSQPLVVTGMLLLLKGRPGLHAVRFAVAYLLFMVPLPSVLVDAATGPLKQWISAIAETVLHGAGYPVARSGVVISIGQYQMLVADACSGLHSMIALAALGTLFIHLMRRSHPWHNVLMLLAILPIAFTANIVRVMVLVLVTYHFGEAAGQGFLHGAAGIVLMLTALCALLALDAALAALLRPR